jgi:small subunit ribosomal protein S20
LANIQSQIKRNRQNEKRRLRNRNMRGSARTAVNQARAAMANAPEESREAVVQAIRELDKSAGKGVIHANKAARLKSRLVKRLAAIGGSTAKKVEATPTESPKPEKKTRAKKTAEK